VPGDQHIVGVLVSEADAMGGPIYSSGWHQQTVPYGFEPHCSSVASVDGASGREPFEFEHSLSIGGVVGVEREMSNLLILLVPGGGVEPPRPCGRRILSPLRLPVPPSRLIDQNLR
jgi:hypothetical protein